MSYNRYRWWTRGRPKKPLPENAPLLLKILNGDFEYSYLFKEADKVRGESSSVYNIAYQNYVGNTESGRVEAAMSASRMKRLKAVKLELEAGKDEDRILSKLKSEFYKEFGVDIWDDIMDGNIEVGTVFDLYYYYKSVIGMMTTPSEFDIKYKRKNSIKYLYLLTERTIIL